MNGEAILEAAIRVQLARLTNLMDAIGQDQEFVNTVLDIARMQDELNAALEGSYGFKENTHG